MRIALDRFDTLVRQLLHLARIPGAGLAVMHAGRVVHAAGYGLRDLSAKLPMTEATVYPIASTTKAMNATLLGMLVDEGKVAWDTPVQHYLPRFRLQDPLATCQVTLRDLLAMRTGLPRHDALWRACRITRSELVDRLAHLPLSAGLRERFQYNNLTATVAGHIAEVVGGQCWEELIRGRIFAPLAMSQSSFARPAAGNVTCSYHENQSRELVPCPLFRTDAIAPAGGSIHSTVEDMARWAIFNLNGGRDCDGHPLIKLETLREIHSPCMIMGADPAAPSPHASYGLGWCIDTYKGRTRISHSGLLHDVHSCVTLLPQDELGIVSFVNFASARLAPLLNQHVFDVIMDSAPIQTFEDRLLQYEHDVATTQQRVSRIRRVDNTVPSHALDDYTGRYHHPGYGTLDIHRDGERLTFERGEVLLALEHWHYDSWAFAPSELFEIHLQHPFERANRIVFETDPDGDIAGLSISLDPMVEPMRFHKQRGAAT